MIKKAKTQKFYRKYFVPLLTTNLNEKNPVLRQKIRPTYNGAVCY